MNCRDFELKILALARDQLMDATAQLSSLAHAEVCTRCADRLAEERSLIAGIRVVATEIGKEDAPTHVQAALRAAFREHATSVFAREILPMLTRRHRPHWRIEAAAVILALISAIAIFWLYSHAQKPKNESTRVLPVPSTLPLRPSVPLHPEVEIGPRSATDGSKIRVQHRAVRRNSTVVEQVTRFFPLKDEEDLNSLEAVQIVRVELPRSALGTVGLPIGSGGVRQRVKADVVLGYDGLARAIRFVR